MFGYILPEKAHLYMKDFDLYRSFYCGICKSMERQFGQLSRFTINYDVTFLAILLHNFLGQDVKMEKLKCVIKPFTTRTNVEQNDLTDILAAYNVILSFYTLYDKVLDKDKKGVKVAYNSLKSAKKKADEVLPGVSSIVERRYTNLRKLESEKCESVDRTSHEFALLMQESVAKIIEVFNDKKAVISEENNSYSFNRIDMEEVNAFYRLCYNVGKWIYLIDGLDDYEKDLIDGSYNPFVYSYKGAKSLNELMENYGKEIQFTFQTCLNTIKTNYEKIKFHFNCDFILNVLDRGMPLMTKGIMRGERCEKSYTKHLN